MYESIDADNRTRKTVYVLQTLWRDLMSEFDIIRPYYTSTSGLKSKFLLPCVMEAIYQFHLFGFEMSLIICDGASANLSMLKALCSREGAYTPDDEQDDKHKVPVSFSNLSTGQKIFQIICQTHQVNAHVTSDVCQLC